MADRLLLRTWDDAGYNWTEMTILQHESLEWLRNNHSEYVDEFMSRYISFGPDDVPGVHTTCGIPAFERLHEIRKGETPKFPV